MGTGIGRIEREFILENLNEKKIPIQIHGYRKTDQGLILRFDDKDITLYREGAVWEHFSPGEEVKAFFSYFGQVMTFTGTVRENSDYLVISSPAQLYKNLQRKYERVNLPGGFVVSFEFEDTHFELKYPKTEEYFDPGKFENMLERAPLHSMILELKKQSERLGLVHSIQMFREREPQNFEEEIVTVTGKILYLPSTDFGYPVRAIDWDNKVLTRGMLQSEDYNALIQHKLDSVGGLDALVMEKKANGISAELFCPLIYLDYVIGIIKISGQGKRDIPKGFLEYVDQFAKALVYNLNDSGYFTSGEPQERTYEAEVLDISASGLLFSHSRGNLTDKILLYTDLDIAFKLGDRKIRIPSRVMRKYSAERRIFFGVQFMEIRPEDFRFLFESVYGRKFSVQDEELWEGGAPPPELTL